MTLFSSIYTSIYNISSTDQVHDNSLYPILLSDTDCFVFMDFVGKISSVDNTVQEATLFYACCTFGYQLCYALVVCIGEWEFVISKYLIDDKLVVVNTILITALNSSPLTGLKSRRASCFMLCIDLLLCYFEHCHACCETCSQLLFF